MNWLVSNRYWKSDVVDVLANLVVGEQDGVRMVAGQEGQYEIFADKLAQINVPFDASYT